MRFEQGLLAHDPAPSAHEYCDAVGQLRCCAAAGDSMERCALGFSTASCKYVAARLPQATVKLEDVL